MRLLCSDSTKGTILLCLMLVITGCSRVASHKTVNPMQSLYIAAKSGDVTQVASILAKNPTLVSAKTEKGCTLLHISSFNWNDDITRALIKAGSKVNVQDYDGDTPLSGAVSAGKASTVRILLENGAVPDLRNPADSTPLWSAVMNKENDIVELLVKHGADVNYSFKGTSILKTAMMSSPKIAAYLEAHGAKLRSGERPPVSSY